MTRSLVSISSLLVLVVLGACAPQEDVVPSGSAGSSAAGSTGAAGASRHGRDHR